MTVITSSEEVYKKNLPMIASLIEDRVFGDRIAGIHLEGPFISKEKGARGCHPAQYAVEPDKARLERYARVYARGHVKLVTLAAELEGAEALCRFAREELNIPAVSLGHQLATTKDVTRLVRDGGATLATHVLNGLPQKIDRHDNPVWPLLALDSVTCMVIADGSHVPPAALACILKAKGRKRVILTSDAAPAAGLPVGTVSSFAGKKVYVEASRILSADKSCLAGSGALLLHCANYVLCDRGLREYLGEDAAITIQDVEAMAFFNPLRAIGVSKEAALRIMRECKRVVRFDGERFVRVTGGDSGGVDNGGVHSVCD